MGLVGGILLDSITGSLGSICTDNIMVRLGCISIGCNRDRLEGIFRHYYGANVLKAYMEMFSHAISGSDWELYIQEIL
jgi:hypothetical protein